MKRIATILFLILAQACTAQVMSRAASKTISEILAAESIKHQPGTYVIKNVNLIAMADSLIIPNQNVLIADGVIKRIGQFESSATVIDGTGKFLMPGLTDMHVHLFDSHPMKEAWLMTFLLYGVTTVRDLCGEAPKILLREQLRSNKILGPTLYQSGPIIHNNKGHMGVFVAANTPDDGRNVVRNQKHAGYDFIKTYNGLSKETYLAILDEARKQSMLVDGHLPDAVSLEEVVKLSHNTIEHLTGYYTWRDGLVIINGVDYTTLSANSKLWNCPTIYNTFLNNSPEAVNKLLSNNEVMRLIPSGLESAWKKRAEHFSDELIENISAKGAANIESVKRIVGDLHRSGAKLIAGTDAGSLPMMIPGYSMHEEMRMLSETGISNFQVLKMATINGALAMRKEKEMGTIEVGKRADLLLLNDNPLKDLKYLRSTAGVMVRGIWLSPDDLNTIAVRIESAFTH